MARNGTSAVRPLLMEGQLLDTLACRIVLAQLEGSGRGSLAAYNKQSYDDLSAFLQNERMVDCDEWLQALLRKNSGLGACAHAKQPPPSRVLWACAAVMTVSASLPRRPHAHPAALRLMEVRLAYATDDFEWCVMGGTTGHLWERLFFSGWPRWCARTAWHAAADLGKTQHTEKRWARAQRARRDHLQRLALKDLSDGNLRIMRSTLQASLNVPQSEQSGASSGSDVEEDTSSSGSGGGSGSGAGAGGSGGGSPQ